MNHMNLFRKLNVSRVISPNDILICNNGDEFCMVLDHFQVSYEYPTKEDCLNALDDFVTWYNNRMSDTKFYQSVENLANVINHHVTQLKEDKWAFRLDFPTRETYEAYILGLLGAYRTLIARQDYNSTNQQGV